MKVSGIRILLTELANHKVRIALYTKGSSAITRRAAKDINSGQMAQTTEGCLIKALSMAKVSTGRQTAKWCIKDSSIKTVCMDKARTSTRMAASTKGLGLWVSV